MDSKLNFSDKRSKRRLELFKLMNNEIHTHIVLGISNFIIKTGKNGFKIEFFG